jgi:hypothetical protein
MLNYLTPHIVHGPVDTYIAFQGNLTARNLIFRGASWVGTGSYRGGSIRILAGAFYGRGCQFAINFLAERWVAA